MISIIVAMTKNRVIGARGSGLLWRLPADLKHFKDLTVSHTVIMGRKTHESIGRALAGRVNVVITRQENYIAPGCVIVSSLEEAISSVTDEEVFVIGGGEIYRQALLKAHRLYVTEIDGDFRGDVLFPEIDEKIWRFAEKKDGRVDEHNLYPHRFLIFDRKRHKP